MVSKLNSSADAPSGAAVVSDDEGANESVGALIAAAKTAMAQEGPTSALPLWHVVRERFPHLPAGHVGYGEALKEAGRLDDAEVILSESIRRFPEDLWAWIHFAQIATRRSDWTEALQRWQEIRERFPDIAVGSVGYAEALKEAGRLDEAEVLLSESIRRFPEDLWAWIHFAQIATRRSDWTEALQRWQEIRERFPDIAAGSVGYAEALMGAGTIDDAEVVLSESIRRFPDDPWAWMHYARVAEFRARTLRAHWAEPLRRWQEVRNRFPEDPVGTAGYANALKERQRLGERCRELLRLLKPSRVEGFRKARFGSPNDGGYVMIDDFNDIAAAFSFGIGQDANWDAAVADRGVPVYQFDHTIDGPPICRPDLIFARLRIAAGPAEGAQTIDELVRHHGSPGKASLILKIDIEGDEWAVFDAVLAAA